MDKSITLEFNGLNEQNKHEKFNRAVGIIAYQLGINKAIKKNPSESESKGEGFYFKAQKELTEKWFDYFDQQARDVYKTLCVYLGLPEATVITKADIIYKGKVVYTPETGTPLKQSDMDRLTNAITKFLNKNKTDSQQMVRESTVLGRLLEKYRKANTMLGKLREFVLSIFTHKGKSFDKIAQSDKSMQEAFDLDKMTMQKIDLYQQSAGQRLIGADNKLVDDVKQILIDGAKKQKNKTQISQELFNQLGAANRDWKKIADTEIQNNMNNAYISAEVENSGPDESIYFQRMEVIDDRTCDFCRKMNGQIVKYSKIPLNSDKITDKYASTAIWEGKEWEGNNKVVTNGIFHPHCRGVWIRWYSFD